MRTRLIGIITCLALVPLFGLGPAGAQSGPPLPCESGFYQVIAGQLTSFDPATDEYTEIGEDGTNYNAMAYRQTDGYLYAVRTNNLLRIDANGVVVEMGQLDMPGSPYTGDFGDDGLLWVSKGGKTWHTIDVDTLEVTDIDGMTSKSTVADVANVHGKFFGISTDGNLHRYDPATLTNTDLGPVEGLPDRKHAYGAAWATAGGNLYIGRNTGEIYQITGYTTDSPKATQVATAKFTQSNDGASCALAPVPPGLVDVDGAEPESPPSTPEAEEATSEYVEQFDELSEDFKDIEGPEAPEPVEVPAQHVEVVTDETEVVELEETTQVETGSGCETTVVEDRLPRMDLDEIVVVDTATDLYSTGFEESAFSRFVMKSGDWTWSEGSFTQHHDCGFDLTVLLETPTVQDFRWEAAFKGTTELNHGGLIFNQSSVDTRSGAVLVDLAEGGTVVRWGEYDEKGHYIAIDRTPITQPAVDEVVSLAVEVHGNDVVVFYNGEEVAKFASTHAGGIVGLVSGGTPNVFEKVALTGLPAATAEPAEKTNQGIGAEKSAEKSNSKNKADSES